MKDIRLTLDQPGDPFFAKQRFIISVSDAGVEIRWESAPVASRDTSVAATVGREPEYVDIVLHVEESSC